jgi:hypothetical protein
MTGAATTAVWAMTRAAVVLKSHIATTPLASTKVKTGASEPTAATTATKEAITLETIPKTDAPLPCQRQHHKPLDQLCHLQ